MHAVFITRSVLLFASQTSSCQNFILKFDKVLICLQSCRPLIPGTNVTNNDSRNYHYFDQKHVFIFFVRFYRINMRHNRKKIRQFLQLIGKWRSGTVSVWLLYYSVWEYFWALEFKNQVSILRYIIYQLPSYVFKMKFSISDDFNLSIYFRIITREYLTNLLFSSIESSPGYDPPLCGCVCVTEPCPCLPWDHPRCKYHGG